MKLRDKNVSEKDSTNRNDFPKENNTHVSENTHKIYMNDKQIEFLIKCIDISQSSETIKPDMSEVELIRELSELNEYIQETKLGSTIYYDLN
jgi:hypothetical protein